MLLKYYLAVLYYIFFELENYNLGGVSNSFWGNCLNKITPIFLNKKNLAFTFFYATVRTFFPFFCDTFFSPTYFSLPLKRCCVSWEEQKNGEHLSYSILHLWSFWICFFSGKSSHAQFWRPCESSQVRLKMWRLCSLWWTNWQTTLVSNSFLVVPMYPEDLNNCYT